MSPRIALAATRAWRHAVSPDRLTGQARANLEHYAYLVRRLGKGTGRYAAQRRVEVRQAMDRCRPAVPVWIMPIYRIAEQLRLRSWADDPDEARRRAAALPVIALTAAALPEERQRCLDAGMNEFIAKPVRVADLERVLRRFAPVRV